MRYGCLSFGATRRFFDTDRALWEPAQHQHPQRHDPAASDSDGYAGPECLQRDHGCRCEQYRSPQAKR